MTALAVIDVCGYVLPAAELLYERAVGPLRGHWPDLGGRLALTLPTPGIGDWNSCYTRFVSDADIGHAADGSPATPSPLPAPVAQRRDFLEPRILHDNARGRLRALENLGIDVQILHPAAGLDTLTELGTAAGALLFNAYNSYVTSYCEKGLKHLKAVLQLHPLATEWAGSELGWWGAHPAVAGVTIHLPASLAADSPELVEVCETVASAGLTLFHRAGSSAAQWTPPAFLSFLKRHGLLDRYPNLTVALVGWPEEKLAEWAPDLWPTAAGSGRVLAAVGSVGSLPGRETTALWATSFPFDAPDLAERVEAVRRTGFGATGAKRVLSNRMPASSAVSPPVSVAFSA